jgi:lathosterol oxidase
MVSRHTIILLIFSSLCWIVQAKPDLLRRLVPFETVTDAAILNLGAIFSYIMTYMIVAGLFEYTNPNEKTKERTESMYQQIALSSQAIVLCATYAIIWMFYIDPMLPYYGYYDRNEYNLIEFAKNLFSYAFIFDTWFYFTHRMFHMRSPINFWKHFHMTHHQFVEDTTAFAQDAVHWVEAIVQGPMGHNLIFALVPMHPIVGQIFGFLTSVYAIGAHDGRMFDFNNHIKHHHYVSVNYGLYWGFWDYVFGTRWSDGKYLHASKVGTD